MKLFGGGAVPLHLASVTLALDPNRNQHTQSYDANGSQSEGHRWRPPRLSYYPEFDWVCYGYWKNKLIPLPPYAVRKPGWPPCVQAEVTFVLQQAGFDKNSSCRYVNIHDMKLPCLPAR